jgi:hypothetical protein
MICMTFPRLARICLHRYQDCLAQCATFTGQDWTGRDTAARLVCSCMLVSVETIGSLGRVALGAEEACLVRQKATETRLS